MEEYRAGYTNFSLGIDNTTSDDDMPSVGVRSCNNADFTQLGAIGVRKPFASLGITGLPAGEIKCIYPFYTKTNDTLLTMVQINTSLYKITSAKVATLVATVTSITSAVTFWSPSLGKEVFIFADNGVIKKYDGTSVTNLSTSAPQGRYLEIYSNRLLVTGAGTAPDAVWISKLGDPEDFTEGVALRNPTWEAEGNTGIESYLDRAYYFMPHSIHAIVGSVLDDFEPMTVINNIGILCPKALCSNGAGIFLIGSNKVCYMFDGRDLHDMSSERVKPFFDNIDGNNLGKIIMYPFGTDIYIVLPQAGDPPVTLMYDAIRNIWTQYDLDAVTAIGKFRVNGVDNVIIGVNGKLLEKKISGRDEVTGIAMDTPFSVEFKPIGGETAPSVKKFKRVFLHALSTKAITLSYWTDLEPSPSVYSYTPSKDIEPVHVSKRGRLLYIQVVGSKDLVIKSIAVMGKEKLPK